MGTSKANTGSDDGTFSIAAQGSNVERQGRLKAIANQGEKGLVVVDFAFWKRFEELASSSLN